MRQVIDKYKPVVSVISGVFSYPFRDENFTEGLAQLFDFNQLLNFDWKTEEKRFWHCRSYDAVLFPFISLRVQPRE